MLNESFCLHCWKSVTIAHCDMCTYKIKLHKELAEAEAVLRVDRGWVTRPGAHDPMLVHWVCPHCIELEQHKEMT